MQQLLYAQPAPGADPYVKVGDTVQKDTKAGLIEIMKAYSHIEVQVLGNKYGNVLIPFREM